MKTLVVLLATVGSFASEPSGLEQSKAAAAALLNGREFAAAVDKAKLINREQPDDLGGYQLLAAAYLGLGDYNEAEKALQWMIDLRIGKADAAGWMLVARFREATGDLEGAMDAVNGADQQLSPAATADKRILLAYSGHLLTIAGKLDAADRALNGALKTDAADANALEELAHLRLAQGRRAEAIDILRRIARPGADPGILYQLAEATRDPDDYVAFERRALETGRAKRQLVLYYAGPGHRPDQAERIARMEAARSSDIFALDALAVALNATAKVSEAKAVMRRVLAVGTKDPEILAHAKQIGVAE
jgi:tetratricopeptide (TPR) repeat protein